MRSLTKALYLSFLLCLLVSADPWAGWIENGIPLTPHYGASGSATIVSDGSSGAIITYQACFEGASHIIAQRFDFDGNPLWGVNGIVVCGATGGHNSPSIISDGSGGAIIAWHDFRNGIGYNDIYAQRVDASGSVLWTSDGVSVCADAAEQYGLQIIPDGDGGAIIVWYDDRNGDYDIYAQRLDASGTILWLANGVTVCSAPEEQRYPRVTADGAGGAIVSWADGRSGQYEAYVQRIDYSGAALWYPNGLPICTASGQDTPEIASDGAGGAIVTWSDSRTGDYNIYAQRIEASGAPLWQGNGLVLCSALNYQRYPYIKYTGSGTAIITWQDYRSGNYDIYAQRIDTSGTALWQEDGVPVCVADGQQYFVLCESDGADGTIVVWWDLRSTDIDLYAQRVDASGTALWQADGVPLCTAPELQRYPRIASDEAGGAIVVWSDDRSGSPAIYAQRVADTGTTAWQADGMLICPATMSQTAQGMIPDGYGGAITAWQDERNGNADVYAQRVDGAGTLLWQPEGVPLCIDADQQTTPWIISDDAGGAIVIWLDDRSENYDIYAQRMDASGTVLWQTDGIPICTEEHDQLYNRIATDGMGGAIVIWRDDRNGNDDIFAQRVDASGTVLWQADGVPICTAPETQYVAQIISDCAGGAIAVWQDERAGVDIYAQHIGASGFILWQADGILICIAENYQYLPSVTSDGTGGAIVSWYDYRSGSADIYAQRVDAMGLLLWDNNGVPVCTASESQYSPHMISDGSGGAIMTWQDYRGGDGLCDIYAQRVDGSGAISWQMNGVPVCTALDARNPLAVFDGDGGAIIAWRDYRCGDPHIYAARVSGSGDLVATLLQTYSASIESGSIRIRWTLSEIDEGAQFTVLRASAPDWRYSEIEEGRIERDGLSFSFTDIGCLPGTTNKYRIDVETEGVPTRTLFETDEITLPAIPLTLYQNHPNPFNPNTIIRFYLPETCEITLDIYNVAGQRVVRLAEGKWQSGHREVEWDGRNGSGAACSSGIYFYRLRAGKSSISRKMVLLR